MGGLARGTLDVVLLLDVYGAREDPLPGVTAALIAQAVPLPADCVFYEPCWVDVPGRLADLVAAYPPIPVGEWFRSACSVL